MGGEDARSGASKSFIKSGSISAETGKTKGVVSNAIGDDGSVDGSVVRGSGERSTTDNRSNDNRNVRDGNGTPTTNRLFEVDVFLRLIYETNR